MSDDLTEEQREELQKLLEELNVLAKSVVEDYTNNPSELSSSLTQVHENSPFLDDDGDDT